MAEVNPPLFLDVDLAYSGDELALPYRDLVSEGVVGSGDLSVSQRAAGANMSVDVAAGACWVRGDTDPARQPTYRCRSDSVVNLIVPAADAANPRKDIVVAEVLDATFVGASRQWRLRYIAGAPAAAPVEPATPDTAIRLATIDVAANLASVQAANITDRRSAAVTGGDLRAPGCRVFHTLAQSIANDADVQLAFNAEEFDTDQMHDVAVNNGRVTIRTPGRYLAIAYASWDSNGIGSRLVILSRFNSGGVIQRNSNDRRAAAFNTEQSIALVQPCLVGDFFTETVRQTSGGALNVPATGATLDVVRIGS